MSKLSINSQKSGIRANSLCCRLLLWTSFCFLHVNKQKRVGMVSTNNITYSEQFYKPFQQKPSQVFLCLKRAGRQMPNTEQLLYQTEKNSRRRFSIKTLFLKILQYSRENTHAKFLRTPFLKNISVRLLLNWLYEVLFGILFLDLI